MKKMKKMKKMTYDELVNWCCQTMLEELYNGSLRSGVIRCIQVVCQWSKEK